MSRIIFNVAAKCDKAGRSQNQDNFWVCPDLDNPSAISSLGRDQDIELSRKGALLAVADGMGGMKSGEKASEFIIEGLKRKFSNIPEEILNNEDAVKSFIKAAIIDADKDIKKYASLHKESEGMGSTVALVWLLGEKAYCGWCGDSRIYCYNPQNSLVRLSHDHSYVQSLVDEGKITEEEAFEHPDGNIITRSLGDSGEDANPEIKVYPIHRRDVFLLCSDGLCGLIPDSELETILADNCTSSADALKSLWVAGEKEGWSDNATIEVACVSEGGGVPTRKGNGYDEGKPKPVVAKTSTKVKDGVVEKNTSVTSNFKKRYMGLFACVLIAAVAIGGYIWFTPSSKKGGKGVSSNQEFTVDASEYSDENEGEVGNSGRGVESGNNISNPGKPQKQNEKPGVTNNKPSESSQPNGNNPGPKQDSPQNVSPEFLSHLNSTYSLCSTIRSILDTGKRPFSNNAGQALKRFQTAAKRLNDSKPKPGLPAAEQKKLDEILGLNNQIDKVLKSSGAPENPAPHKKFENIPDKVNPEGKQPSKKEEENTPTQEPIGGTYI